MHGKYVREKEGIDWDRTWQWIAKRDLKGCTETPICSVQEQALRTIYKRFHIDHTRQEDQTLSLLIRRREKGCHN